MDAMANRGPHLQDAGAKPRGGPAAAAMSKERFAEVLARMGWGHRTLSDHLGINPTTPRKLAQGKMPVSAFLGDWMEQLAAALDAGASPQEAIRRHPRPEGWEATAPASRSPSSR